MENCCVSVSYVYRGKSKTLASDSFIHALLDISTDYNRFDSYIYTNLPVPSSN